jgi:hypothetical protein
MSSTPTRTNPFARIENEGLDDFKPKSTPIPVSRTQDKQPTDIAQAITRAEEKTKLVKLAENEGFTINNFDEKPIPARIAQDAKTFLKTVRIHVSDWNRFQLWCHENGYTHRKGFQVLAASLPPKKA